MGLLTVPKRHNPRGNGKRDIEDLIYANKAEQGLLRAHGGSGKKTKYGVPSFSYEDSHPESSYGSRQGSSRTASSGGGAGGGGSSARTPTRTIAPSRPRPVAIPVPRPKPTPPVQPSMYMDPQIAGRLQQALASPNYPNSMPGNSNPNLHYGPGTSSPFSNSMPGNSNPNMHYGPGTGSTPANQPFSNSMPGNSNRDLNYGNGTETRTPFQREADRRLAADGLRDQYSQYRSPPGIGRPPSAPPQAGNRADPSYFGDFRAPRQDFTSPEQEAELDRIAEVVNRPAAPYMDPSVPGQNQYATRPGAGVPDLPIRGQTEYKVPGERINMPPSSQPQGLGSISDMLNGLKAGMPETDQLADMFGQYPSEEGQIYNPYSLSNYMPQPKIPGRIQPSGGYREQVFNDFRHPMSALRGSVPSNVQEQTASIDPTGYTQNQQPTDITPEGQNQRMMDAANPDAAPERDLYARQNKLQQVASKIMDFLPGGKGLANTRDQNRDRLGAAGDVLNDRSDYTDPIKQNAPPRTQDTVTPPVTPPGTPATPAPANWYFPQYTQGWAGLPTGLGGPIWRPSAPTGGIFDDLDKKKKSGSGSRGRKVRGII